MDAHGDVDEVVNPRSGERIRFLQTSEHGATRLEVTLSPGAGGPAPHRHVGYEEHYLVRSGQVHARIGGVETVLGPGERAAIPAGVAHSFANVTDAPAVLEVELQPGHAGFEQALRILCGLAGDGGTDAHGMPRSPVHLAILGQMSDMRAAGPRGLLAPVVPVLAAWGRSRGIEADVVDRYARPRA